MLIMHYKHYNANNANNNYNNNYNNNSIIISNLIMLKVKE